MSMDIKTEDLIGRLRYMTHTTGDLCTGCGYEHGCHFDGCAILRQTVALLEKLTGPTKGTGDTSG